MLAPTILICLLLTDVLDTERPVAAMRSVARGAISALVEIGRLSAWLVV
jgi:hypothetical protein